MKKTMIFLALATVGLASCNGFKKGDSGMLYNIVVNKGNPRIMPGDFISLNVTLKTDADSLLGSTYESGRPYMNFMQKPQAKGDIYTAFEKLGEGDSAIVKLNIDSLAKGQKRPAGMKGKYQVYYLKVEKVISKGNLSPEVFKGRYMAYVNQLQDAVKKQEPGKIKKYIADNKLKVTTTPSGLNYVITTPGSGPDAVNGDTVVVSYVGKFLNGKVFDTSIKTEAVKAKLQINPMSPYKPIHFALGTQGMIKGWNEGFLLFNKGTKATFILPSSIGYGEQGGGQIGPYTPLVFDVELVDIIHPNPNAPKPAAPKPLAQVPQQPVRK